ncbi:MAG: hypothetical protein Satyrvirus1_32 [Satyrvirus sp.]|uniref:Uncharacterized protein n=1 Tax=Satyrvirus sp. TaxID=2487771 RepID=A0A3G5ACL1_9VIRU|nr:MAG: hypothetical protein Satyrvirus1_32 [Satyrvirus sp.]
MYQIYQLGHDGIAYEEVYSKNPLRIAHGSNSGFWNEISDFDKDIDIDSSTYKSEQTEINIPSPEIFVSNNEQKSFVQFPEFSMANIIDKFDDKNFYPYTKCSLRVAHDGINKCSPTCRLVSSEKIDTAPCN